MNEAELQAIDDRERRERDSKNLERIARELQNLNDKLERLIGAVRAQA